MFHIPFLIRLFIATLAAAIAIDPANASTGPWSFEQDQELGFRYAYPPIFSELGGDGKPAFHYFASHGPRQSFLSAHGIIVKIGHPKSSSGGSSLTLEDTTTLRIDPGEDHGLS